MRKFNAAANWWHMSQTRQTEGLKKTKANQLSMSKNKEALHKLLKLGGNLSLH